jgi:hypothetical protein
MNQEVESRLVKLENCCADYRTQIGELEERLRQVRSYEREVIPEFNRFADSEVEASKTVMERRFEEIEKRKKEFNSTLQTRKPHRILEYIEWGNVYENGLYLNRDLYEIYKQFMHFAQLYKLAGNISLFKKYTQDAEKIYDEIEKNEDKMEETYEEQKVWMKTLSEKGARQEEYMYYKDTPVKDSVFEIVSDRGDPYVRLPYISRRITQVKSKGVSQKASEGGRRNKSRKRK